MTTQIFPGRYESLAKIADFVRSEAKQAGFSFKEIFEIETAVDEAVSNIIEHAYGGEGIGDITCSCTTNHTGLKIILEDHGQPFNPACIPVPDVKAKLKDRPEHGLGFYMMCQLLDDVHFDFGENSNKLTLFKRFQEN